MRSRFFSARPNKPRAVDRRASPMATVSEPRPPARGSIRPSALAPLRPATPLDAALAAHARTVAVAASGHSVGRERFAMDLLQTSMSAAEITGLLAKTPKGNVANAMLAALNATLNPELDTDTPAPRPADDAGRAESRFFWDSARLRP